MKKILNQQNGQQLLANVKIANNFFSRLKGLMFATSLPHGHGILISPCQQVHTHFMRFTIDIFFLDSQMRVLKIIRHLKPWRFSPFVKPAHYVLEVSSAFALDIQVGDQLMVAD